MYVVNELFVHKEKDFRSYAGRRTCLISTKELLTKRSLVVIARVHMSEAAGAKATVFINRGKAQHGPGEAANANRAVCIIVSRR